MDHGQAALIGLAIAGVLGCVLLAVVRRPRRDPQQAFDAFLATRYFSGLDALRAFSVIGVIWTHVSGVHALHLLNQGNRGVDLFFAISGFLVTTLLLRERRRTGQISLRDFYMRRTLRIFPLYYAVLLLYVVLVFATLRGTPKGAEFWSNLPAFASYTSNWFVSIDNGAAHGVTFYFAWSLATEEQFYLFWPSLMVLLYWKTRSDAVLVAAPLALLGIQIVAATLGGGTLAGTILASLAPAILLGVVFAVLLDNRAAYAVLYRILGHRAAAPIALALLLLLLQVGAPLLASRFVMAVLVAAVCIREDTWLHPILTWRPAVFVGTISYGIYLMHMLAANAVRKVVGHDFGLDVFAGATLLVIVMAALSFRYFESPLLALKKRFGAARREAPQAGGLGQAANV